MNAHCTSPVALLYIINHFTFHSQRLPKKKKNSHHMKITSKSYHLNTYSLSRASSTDLKVTSTFMDARFTCGCYGVMLTYFPCRKSKLNIFLFETSLEKCHDIVSKTQTCLHEEFKINCSDWWQTVLGKSLVFAIKFTDHNGDRNLKVT